MVVFSDETNAIHESLQNPDELQYPFLLPEPRLASVAKAAVPEPDPSWLDVLDEKPVTEADGNGPGRSLMFGRYMGQISARIERAWLRPRVTLRSGSFACRVEITQDPRGNVQEVTLKKCTDQPQWQVSLVQAIQQASPLPAPPDPSVFSNLLILDFESDAFVAGSQEDLFEPPPKLASGNSVSPALLRSRHDGSADLIITGSPRSN